MNIGVNMAVFTMRPYVSKSPAQRATESSETLPTQSPLKSSGATPAHTVNESHTDPHQYSGLRLIQSTKATPTHTSTADHGHTVNESHTDPHQYSGPRPIQSTKATPTHTSTTDHGPYSQRKPHRPTPVQRTKQRDP
ncbi:hypothetical protein Btru_069660 [Bulinus truncatus]|nr:hypothetical protein Btru_069660 [Bulinus truncatus]